MGKVHELRVRSNQFAGQIEMKIADAVTGNPYLVALNQKQMQASELSTGGPIINTYTGSPYYSNAYAAYKGFRTPDLKDTGDFYKAMDISYSNKQYNIDSSDWKKDKLVKKYKPEIFGIGKKLQPEAQRITTAILKIMYQQDVING